MRELLLVVTVFFLLNGCNSSHNNVVKSSYSEEWQATKYKLVKYIRTDNLSEAKILLNGIKFDDTKTNDLTREVYQSKSPQMIKLLVSYGAGVNGLAGNSSQTVLIDGVFRVVKASLYHPLSIYSIQSKDTDTIEAFLDAGSDPALGYQRVPASKRYNQKNKKTGKIILHSEEEKKKLDEKIAFIEAYSNNPLHIAIKRGNLKEVKSLIKKDSSLLSSLDRKGRSPFQVASDNNKLEIQKYLSCKLNKNCHSVSSFEIYISSSCSAKSSLKKCKTAIAKDIHGVFVTSSAKNKIAASDFDLACKKFSYTKCNEVVIKFSGTKFANKAQQLISAYQSKGEVLFNKNCGETGTKWACKNFIDTHKGLIAESRSEHALLVLSQACRVNEDGWIYQGDQCKGSWVHGEGKSINSEKNLSFIGLYRNGKRVKGLLSYNNQPMFDGVVSNGRPNGEGICFYKGDPEKCEFYKGKRVDAIFKQRIANAEQERKMDAKLAEMKKLQLQQNNKISQMQGQINSSRQNTSSGGGGIGQQIGDYALKKAGEKVMDSLFDKLF